MAETPSVVEQQKQSRELLENFFRIPMADIKKRMEVIREFLDTIRGVKDVKGKMAPLMEPEGKALLTTTILSHPQTTGIAIINTFYELYPDIYQPLKVVGDDICYTEISHNGVGRMQDIQLMSAYSGERLLRDIGMSLAPSSDLARKKAEQKGEMK